jgi:hypothetical protein
MDAEPMKRASNAASVRDVFMIDSLRPHDSPFWPAV